MIAVTGATGQLGPLVIQKLLSRVEASQIVALARNPEKLADLVKQGVQVRQADYSQPETLGAALDGVKRLLLISSSEVGARVPQHQAVIDAAKTVNLELFAYTSILKSDESPLMLAAEHRSTEAAIKEAGLPAVILRDGWYTENYTMNIAGVLQAGAVAGAAGDGKFSTARRSDYAEAAAIVLTSEGHIGQCYELAGDEAFTLTQFAAEIGRQTGKEIPFQNMSGEDFCRLLVQIGLPEGFAAALADSEGR
jgi:NAD(P)H dehydrogenase (quinone)